jgi:phosphatidate phosphatase
MEPVKSIKILIDIFTFIIAIVAWTLVDLYLPRSQIGFRCDDTSLSLPYKESTVQNNIQILISIFLPLILISATEIIRRFYISYKTKSKYVYKVSLRGKIINVPDTIGSLYINLGSYFFGLIVVSLLVNIGKYTFGRLRPHYFDVCQPLFIHKADNNVFLTKPDCNIKRFYEHKVDYICRGKNMKRLEDASLSFPSQITALVFYAIVYLILYIRFTWKFRKFGLLTPFLQACLISIGTFIAATRVADYKHFMGDIAAGAFLGVFTGIIVFCSLTDLSKECEIVQETDIVNSEINRNLSREESIEEIKSEE